MTLLGVVLTLALVGLLVGNESRRLAGRGAVAGTGERGPVRTPRSLVAAEVALGAAVAAIVVHRLWDVVA